MSSTPCPLLAPTPCGAGVLQHTLEGTRALQEEVEGRRTEILNTDTTQTDKTGETMNYSSPWSDNRAHLPRSSFLGSWMPELLSAFSQSRKNGKAGFVLLLSKVEQFIHYYQYSIKQNTTAARSWMHPNLWTIHSLFSESQMHNSGSTDYKFCIF